MKKRNTLVIRRSFNAPIEKVWKAWTNTATFKKWWGPKGFTTPHASMDVEVGGTYLYCMRGAPRKGAPKQDFWGTGTYKEIVQHKKLMYTDSFADEKGNVVPGTYYGMSKKFPRTMMVTVTFRGTNGKTDMTLQHAGMPDSDKTGAQEGWGQSFDKLAALLKK